MAGQYVFGTALYNEDQIEFLRNGTVGQNLIRGQAGLCVAWIEDQKIFCREKTVAGLDTCMLHKDQSKPDLMKVVSAFGKERKEDGFHIMKGVCRWTIESRLDQSHAEFCPSLKGANGAFRYSLTNFEKFLIACSETHHLVQVLKHPFHTNFFKAQFPNFGIKDDIWYHAYLAMNVSV